MKITIIGWYGTETIGDRAILAGLFHLFAESYEEYEVQLGCLDTLLTERTIYEDQDFFSSCANGKLKTITLFDSRKKSELDAAIIWSDVLVIGGGPLMEIEPMYMLLYALKKAKKLSKKNIVAGCGMGPFKTSEFLNVATQIINLSDIAIFRDNKSQNIYANNSEAKKDTIALIDPAAIASQCFLNLKKPDNKENYIAINFRKPPVCEYDGLEKLNTDFFVSITKHVSENYIGDIHLIPMHTYGIGDDDRIFLNKIARISGESRISVQNKPLSLEQTMLAYYNAEFCIGMRFHAVLLQTFVNGKNIVLDYTDPHKGKIVNLLNQLDLLEGFQNDGRYLSLVNKTDNVFSPLSNIRKTTVSNVKIETMKKSFIQALRSIL